MSDTSVYVSDIVSYLSKYVEYVDYDEVMDARHRMYKKGEYIEEDIPVFISFASYIGTLKRLAYYNFVHKQGVDVRYLADASVKAFMFSGVYRFELQRYLRRKVFNDVINKTRYPKWTRLGLIGGSTREIIDLGEEFAEYMDEAKEAY